MTDRQLFQLVLRQLQHTIAYSNEEMKVLDDLKGLVRERLSQPEPEPVAWMNEKAGGYRYYSWQKQYPNDTPLYTAPPKREWVGLTDDELRAAYRKGRDSIPSPDSGWEWVDNHTPGLREVELTLYRKNNNGDVV